MGFAKLERVALVVDDLAAVSADLKRVFDIDLSILEAEQLGIRAALGNDGIELVERIPGTESKLEQYWRGPLAALCIRVDDLDAAEARMAECGIKLVQRVKVGSLRELLYGAYFHGLPIVLYEQHGDDLAGEAGHAHGEPEIEWYE